MTQDSLTNLARGLRQHSTDAEKKLWQRLRSKEFGGLKFRRQEPVGPYIVDFVCFEKKLVIELDGGQHALGGALEKDKLRDEWLTSEGFKVLRFWNNDVLNKLEGVLLSVEKKI